jgi:hypothetical protein
MSARRLLLTLPLVGLLVSGCTTGSDGPVRQSGLISTSSVSPVARLPEPMPGDRLRYDQGASLRVTAVDDTTVTLRRGKSTTIVRPRNPFLPPLASDSRRFEISSTLDAPPDALFPLAAGNTVSFEERRRVRSKYGGRERLSTRQWRCAVGEPTTVTVPLGTFEAWPVRCDNPARNAFLRNERSYVWHYAPSLGQVVQERYERFGQAPRVKQLQKLTTRAPLGRGPAFAEAMQSSFETARSGEPVAWHDESTTQQGRIVIRRTTRRADGTYCREAEVTIVTGSTPLVQELRACRQPDGHWQPEV